MKNKKLKSIVAALLSVAMLVSFAACGESDSETEEKKDSAGASASDSADVDSDTDDNETNTVDDRIGTYITFGTYEQDGDTTNGAEPIEWLVLETDGNKKLLISRYALDAKAYNEVFVSDITWENCTLRNWLNNDFYNTAFSSDEKNSILTTNVAAEDNVEYSVDAGNDTQDKVFLLSISEAEKYFDSDSERMCKPTQYAINQGAGSHDGNCWCWLRSPGGYTGHASIITYVGGVSGDGIFVDDSNYTIRPAMWVELG